MKPTRRTIGLLVLGAGACVLVGPAVARLFAHPGSRAETAGAAAAGGQEQAPNRRDFTITAGSYQFSPNRIEVMQDDLVKITVRSEDEAHSFTIDEYRIVKRIPANGSTTFEFRADRPGTFAFYCGMTSADGHRRMRGELVVVPRR
jgi:heme/copper-type cytochrome/quinol oxidase subunit 2